MLLEKMVDEMAEAEVVKNFLSRRSDGCPNVTVVVRLVGVSAEVEACFGVDLVPVSEQKGGCNGST